MGLESVFIQRKYDSNSDGKRTVVTVGDGDCGFTPDSIRALQSHDVSASLGNHYREYPEMYGIIGKATFTLEDIETKRRLEYELNTGDRIFISPRVAIKVNAVPGTVLIISAPKADRKKQTYKYEVK